MNPWGVLWDLDGVLADTEDLHYESRVQTLADYAMPFSRAQFRATFGMNNAGTLGALWPSPPPAELIAEISRRKEEIFRQLLRGRVQALPGVHDWLERFLRWGYRQAVASSAPAANIDALVDELEIRPYFLALTAGDGLPSKPDPAVFLEAAGAIDVAPGRCLVIEDAMAGVTAARRAGMRCIAVATTHPAAALQGADLVVNRLSELSPQALRAWLGSVG